MIKRLCTRGFLSEFLELAQTTEVPDPFGVWVGVSICASCLGRKCFIRTRPIVYPNLYVVLVAESAICRKTTAIDLGRPLLRKLDNCPRMLSQKFTAESLIGALRKPKDPIISVHNSSLNSEVLTPQTAEGTIISSELGSLINIDSYRNGLVDLLTDLYDSHQDEFTYTTRTHGDEVINYPCISLLGATTMSWMRSTIPVEALGGGFASRVIFVHSKPSNRNFAWPDLGPETRDLEARLLHDLNLITQLNGEFKIGPEARNTFKDLYEKYKNDRVLGSDANLSSYLGRRGTTLQKVAMVFSASRGDSMEVTSDDFTYASEAMRKVELSMPNLFQAITSTVDGQVCQDILLWLQAQGPTTRTNVVRKFSHKLHARGLDEALATLEGAGQIQARIDGNKTMYFPLQF